MRRALLRTGRLAVRFVEVVLVLTYVLFEELVWEQFVLPVRRAMETLVRPRVEAMLAGANRYTVFALFTLLLASAEGLGVAAGAVFVMVDPLLGVVLYALKVLLAGIAFWVFAVAKEKLFEIALFKKSYDAVMRAVAWVTHTEVYRAVKTKTALYKVRFKAWLAARRKSGRFTRLYAAIKRLFRR